METNENACIICKKFYGRLIIILEKTRNTLIKCSESRKDSRHEEFRSASKIHIHAANRNIYTKPSEVVRCANIACEEISISIPI